MKTFPLAWLHSDYVHDEALTHLSSWCHECTASLSSEFLLPLLRINPAKSIFAFQETLLIIPVIILGRMIKVFWWSFSKEVVILKMIMETRNTTMKSFTVWTSCKQGDTPQICSTIPCPLTRWITQHSNIRVEGSKHSWAPFFFMSELWVSCLSYGDSSLICTCLWGKVWKIISSILISPSKS